MMGQAAIYAMVAILVFSMSLYGLIAYAHLVRKIMALNIMASAVFLFFGAMARRGDPATTDAVPQAMVITGIVVAVAATAYAISLARQIARETGRMQLPEEAVSTRDAMGGTGGTPEGGGNPGGKSGGSSGGKSGGSA